MRIPNPDGGYYSDNYADDSNYRTPMNLFPPNDGENYEYQNSQSAVPYSLQYPPAYGEDFTYPNPTATVHSSVQTQLSQVPGSNQQHAPNNLAQEHDDSIGGDTYYNGGSLQAMDYNRYEYEYPSGNIGLPVNVKDEKSGNHLDGSSPVVVYETAIVTSYSTTLVYTTTQSTVYAAQSTPRLRDS